ncbi:hypothetical protein EYZ11_009958 [Aspergillus tanneri]|uniref:Uncharacterized protein n=1 Tax=Aspergillus tanneri TaxID=1220188 RepID=A0A4S3J6K5_9EURO|nr:uncharacterized protein ATNIH1004_005465 [Aspergillus tanneri]KAA8646790.1 hypothetical protein ATNIH1004_005465 [Aspergillus tanneri]THC90579.1 hypothetical protein EYZ11_009958 [Aspergillus tanneri]
MTTVPRPSSDTLTDSVANQVAIVTGAAQGIGLATAVLLARHGARVVLVDCNEAALQEARETVGKDAPYRICDVGDWEQQVALFQWVTNTVGHVDLVVCNAAVNPEIALLQTHDESQCRKMSCQVCYNYLADEHQDSTLRRPYTQLFDVNLHSVIFGLKLAIHHMRPRGRGRIIVTGSAASYVPVPSQTLYTASKHAVLGLVRSTALMDEVTSAGIAISWVAPWLTLTPMVQGLAATVQDHMLRSLPEDVAWAIATAACNWAHAKGYWIQGQNITEVEGAYGEMAGSLMLPKNKF